MPRFHFAVERGRIVPDRDGAELADLGAARVVAVKTLAELVREHDTRFWDLAPLRVVVSDASGSILFAVEACTRERGELDCQLGGRFR